MAFKAAAHVQLNMLMVVKYLLDIFSKEFDKVLHNQLYCELIFYGVQNGTLSYIRNFFTRK